MSLRNLETFKAFVNTELVYLSELRAAHDLVVHFVSLKEILW